MLSTWLSITAYCVWRMLTKGPPGMSGDLPVWRRAQVISCTQCSEVLGLWAQPGTCSTGSVAPRQYSYSSPVIRMQTAGLLSCSVSLSIPIYHTDGTQKASCLYKAESEVRWHYFYDILLANAVTGPLKFKGPEQTNLCIE